MPTRSKPETHQLPLPFKHRGGKRPGAGRPKRSHETVPHSTRAPLAPRHPLHITLRLRTGLPTLRKPRTYAALRKALQAGAQRLGFRLVHYSVLSNHFHLLVEAHDRPSLTQAMRGLTVRIARALNRLWSRTGPVFAERYHDRVLETPTQVRNALRYVLNNARKHGLALPRGQTDAYSSSPWFDGWRGPVLRRALGPVTSPVARARTWLLTTGWRRLGLIPVDEVPGRRPRRRTRTPRAGPLGSLALR